LIVVLGIGSALAGSDDETDSKVEPVEATICRITDSSARAQNLPVMFLTRLVWQESSFRADAISPAGARGIAQFMPRTAGERGLTNPFDPAEAIPKAAELIGDLRKRFGNLGLAAAAYNAGAGRVAAWLAAQGSLPTETQNYVRTITLHSVNDWIPDAGSMTSTDSQIAPAQSCLQEIAAIRRSEPRHLADSAVFSPWGVQLVGSYSKAAALAVYARAQKIYSAILGDSKPMVLGGRAPGRGFAPFYQIRAPAPSRAAANALCEKILRLGGACAVLRS
jgi:hypothetical protein